MRWKPRPPKARLNRNPYKDWVKLRWCFDADAPTNLVCGRFWINLCESCGYNVWLERRYFRMTNGAPIWKCGVCMDLDQLAGKEKL